MKTSLTLAVALSLILAAPESVSAQQSSQPAKGLARTIISDSESDTTGARVRGLADAHLAAFFDQHPEWITCCAKRSGAGSPKRALRPDENGSQ